MKFDRSANYDGFQVLNQGVDSGNLPNIIGRQRLAFAVNCTLRGGFVQTRPGWRKHDVTWPRGVPGALFQGAGSFNPMQGGDFLTAAIAGRYYTIDVDAQFAVRDITPASGGTLATLPKVWWAQSEDYLLASNAEQATLVYSGAPARYLDPTAGELPPCAAMENALGRTWIIFPNLRGYAASDLVGSSSGTGPGRRDAVLKMTHNTYLSEGGTFTMGQKYGPARAVRQIALIDTSLGQGPVQVFGTSGALGVNAPFDDTQWASTTNPTVVTSLLGAGAVSQEATVNVNGDIWFRSGDGIRSYQIARRDWGVWANTPQSFEVTRLLRYDDPALLDHCSGAYFDQRLLVTVSPQHVNGHGTIWNGLAALDFAAVGGIGSENQTPLWEGVWTGLAILQVVPLSGRLFAFVLSSGNEIELWELTSDDENILYDRDGTVRIASSIETSAYNFKGGWDLYRLRDARLWSSMLAGQVDFAAFWKPDKYPAWVPWSTWTEQAKSGLCSAPLCPGVPTPYQPEFRTYIPIGLPPDTCDAITKRNLRLGYEYQLRLNWLGPARLDKLMLVADTEQEDVAGVCAASRAAVSDGVQYCGDDDYTYHA